MFAKFTPLRVLSLFVLVALLAGFLPGLVQSASAGPKECPPGQRQGCVKYHKTTPGQGCVEAWFPKKSNPKGWKKGPCPAPTSTPTPPPDGTPGPQPTPPPDGTPVPPTEEVLTSSQSDAPRLVNVQRQLMLSERAYVRFVVGGKADDIFGGTIVGFLVGPKGEVIQKATLDVPYKFVKGYYRRDGKNFHMVDVFVGFNLLSVTKEGEKWIFYLSGSSNDAVGPLEVYDVRGHSGN